MNELRLGDKFRAVEDYASSLGFKYHQISVRSRWDSQAIQALAETLERLRPNVVHAHDVKASFYLSRVKTQKTLKPRIGTKGTPSFQKVSTHHGVRGRPGLINKLYERVYSQLILPRFDRVLCVCHSDRELLLRRGIPSSKLITHLNGVTRELIFPEDRPQSQRTIREKWRHSRPELKPDCFTLGMVGRYSLEKRHSLLLQSLARTRQRRPDLDWQLLCFGSGALETELKSLTMDLGLQNQVHWMGYRKTVGNEFSGFDLLVSISIAEGLPINLIEAGWAGTPALATWIDGNRDLFPDEGHGVLISPTATADNIARSLIEILEDPKRREAMALKFQNRVRSQFSREVWLKKLHEIYAALDHRSVEA